MRNPGVVPFLTCKHPLDFCLAYADRAHHHGFDALVVLGGDKSVGPPRCVEHAWQLREEIRRRVPQLALGGWANPHGDCARQVDHLLDDARKRRVLPDADRLASQPCGCRSVPQRGARQGLAIPGLFGLFYYRSANPKTLASLSTFLPVPVEELKREFGDGATADEICARSLRTLADAGVRHFYISNLPLGRAATTLRRIMDLASLSVISSQ